MIRAIGIDIVDVERIEKAMQNPRFIKRILTEKEIASIDLTPARVAGRWAAKEAVLKCLKSTKRGKIQITSWHQVEIFNMPDGNPIVKINHPGLSKFMDWGWHTLVSISHEKKYAVATAVNAPRSLY